MAISLNGTPTFTNGDASSFTFSHTVNAGTNKLLVVRTAINDNLANIVTSVTFSGLSLTQHRQVNTNSTLTNGIFYLKEPPEATANVVVTLSVGNKGVVGATTYDGVEQTTTFGASGTDTDVGRRTMLPSLTATQDDSWIIGHCMVRGDETIVLSGTQTQEYQAQSGGSNPQNSRTTSVGDHYNSTVVSGNTYTFDYTITATDHMQAYIVELHPAAVAGGYNFGFIM